MILRTVTLAGQYGTVTLGAPSYATGDAVGFTLDQTDMNAGPTSLQREQYPLAPGGMVVQLPVGPREVQLAGSLWASSASEANALRSDLVAACTGTVLVTFQPKDVPLQLTGQLDGTVEFSDAAGFCLRWRLRIVCADPVAYAVAETTAAIGGSAAPVVMAGDGEVWPELRFTVVAGTLTSLLATSARTIRSVQLSGLSATAGSVVTVQMQPGYEEVLLNGVTPLMDKLTPTSRFWSLLPGSNQVNVTAAGASVSGSVVYRNGWVS